MSKKYVYADRDQLLLMPPDLREWIDEDHEARLVLKFIGQMDLSGFYEVYESETKSLRGRPPYDPAMMLALIYYCSLKKQYASRQIERMTFNDLGARFIAGNHHPDHDSFAAFRIRHQELMVDIFSQVLMLCNAAGLVDLQHVAVDSTVIHARASRSKNLEVEELDKTYEKCKAEAAELVEKLAAADKEEEEAIRKSVRDAETRKARVKRAMEYIKDKPSRTAVWEKAREDRENRAQEASIERKAALKAQGQLLKQARKALGLSMRDLKEKIGISHQLASSIENGRFISSKNLSLLLDLYGLNEEQLPPLPERPAMSPLGPCPQPQSLVNESDPESYLTFRKAYGYRQGFLAQAAVDSLSQVIVAVDIAENNDDHPYLVKLNRRIQAHFGRLPDKESADTGYVSEEVLNEAELEGIDLYCPPSRYMKNTDTRPKCAAMREKLKTPEGKAVYDQRSGIVEPVFGNIKYNQGFTRFLRVGLKKVMTDWAVVATGHNLRKIFQLWTS